MEESTDHRIILRQLGDHDGGPHGNAFGTCLYSVYGTCLTGLLEKLTGEE